MAIAWQDRFTPLANVNNGNELEDGDTATGGHITVALENGEYVKNRLSFAHYITMTFSSGSRTATVYFTIIDRDETPITKDNIASRFRGSICCSGKVSNSNTQHIEFITRLSFSSTFPGTSFMTVEYTDIINLTSDLDVNLNTSTISTFTDNVI